MIAYDSGDNLADSALKWGMMGDSISATPRGYYSTCPSDILKLFLSVVLSTSMSGIWTLTISFKSKYSK